MCTSQELSDIQKSTDLSVACRDSDVRSVKAIIMGPHETPYEFGFFEFAVRFGKEYPSKAPNVRCLTTNGGRCRFNPNIYANGKFNIGVCSKDDDVTFIVLTGIRTWRGERGEEWSSAQGLESILLSIQSLMSGNPYENEPGFEDMNEESDKQLQKAYADKIRHETLRISVIQRMEEYLGIKPDGMIERVTNEQEPGTSDMDEDPSVPFEPFKDLCKRRFLWYYESYLAAVQQGKAEINDQQNFTRMPFESPSSNSIEGKFYYTNLERRLQTIKARLDAEPEIWAKEGLLAVNAETTVAVNLKHQYEQVLAAFKRSDLPHDIKLENDNPFVWVITYFGKPMTNLDGGLFRIKMHFSPKFPHEQPRVRFETKIFHHHVAPDGTACYATDSYKREDVRSHIEAIIACLEDDEPAYDPRKTVNPEASKLLWSNKPEDKKKYNRMLRRSVQRSME
ncbi:hypothetical protein S40285_00849 [Stachybotrys chlorohalonatus IBT 40285]|uniref:UBC core domain-containing protein n=1 Tax=Stachybotrys chlorohalonatus (strain IBT 40285) TaxID=1283841 RepID=A0A084QJR4_STAC4|nr:hypothetical protein S40285_00849 [Stachybotrys chlorohalonata IBT 40285]